MWETRSNELQKFWNIRFRTPWHWEGVSKKLSLRFFQEPDKRQHFNEDRANISVNRTIWLEEGGHQHFSVTSPGSLSNSKNCLVRVSSVTKFAACYIINVRCSHHDHHPRTMQSSWWLSPFPYNAVMIQRWEKFLKNITDTNFRKLQKKLYFTIYCRTAY